MGWADIKSGGRGKLAFRLQIEGLGTEFVTDSAMQVSGGGDGRVRVAGLIAEGISWGERVDPISGKVDGDGFTAQIVDRQTDDAITAALAIQPSATTYMTTDATKSQNYFDVENPSSFSAGDVVHIGTEAVLVGATGDGQLASLTRGYWSTIPQAHYTKSGEFLAFPAIHNKPAGVEGRRARLYAYGEGDAVLGQGELVWRGICATDAKLASDGTTWEISIDPITSIMTSDLGSDLSKPRRPRGIYFPTNSPLSIHVREYLQADHDQIASESHTIAGHFENVEALADKLNDMFTFSVFTIFSASGRIKWEPFGTQSVRLRFTMPASATTFYRHTAYVNGIMLSDRYGEGAYDEIRAEVADTALANSTTYWLAPIDVGNPSGHFGRPLWGTLPDTETATNFPANRIYLDGEIFTGDSGLAYVEWDSNPNTKHAFHSRDESARWIQLYYDGTVDETWGRGTGHGLPDVSFRRTYANGDLADWRDDLVATSPTLANRGDMPLVTASDLASWSAVVDEAHGDSNLLSNRYYWSQTAVQVDELVAGDCQMLGCFPHTDSDGKIALSRFRVPLPTDPADYTVNILTDRGLPTWEWTADGTVNVMEFQTEWNGDEHIGPTMVVRDVSSISERRNGRTIQISPQSWGPGTTAGGPFYDEFVDIARPMLSAFAGKYAYVMCDIAMTAWGVSPGDIVDLSHPALPDPLTGTRGLTGAKGLVLGRWWEPSKARGRLLCYVTYERYGGYSPAWYITSDVDNGGDEWTIGLSALETDLQHGAPSFGLSVVQGTEDATDHFEAGDEVEVIQWNTSAGTAVSGDIVAVSASSATVQFDATWTPGTTNGWILRYRAASVADSGQEDYIHVADSSHVIAYPSGNVTARVLA